MYHAAFVCDFDFLGTQLGLVSPSTWGDPVRLNGR